MTIGPPEEIHGISHSQLSIARYYGGIKFNGAHYTYFPVEDKLVRDDVLNARAKSAKLAKKAEKEAIASSQQSLIEDVAPSRKRRGG